MKIQRIIEKKFPNKNCFKGRRHYFYTKKFGKDSLGSNSDFFEFENILTAEDSLGQTYEKAYLGIFTLTSTTWSNKLWPNAFLRK